MRVCFDVEEALQELTRLELVERVEIDAGNGNGNGSDSPVYRCVKPEDATQRLDKAWRAILQSRLRSVEAPL